MIKCSLYHFCFRQIHILVIWCKCTELSPAGLYLWEQWLQVLLLLALLWTLFALLQHFSFNQTSQGTWRKSCPISVVPILSKYSPSQTFTFTWELLHRPRIQQVWIPFSVVVKAFLCWKKGCPRIKNLWENREMVKKRSKLSGSLPLWFFSYQEEALWFPWGPSQHQAVSDSESVCATNFNTLVKISIQETGTAKHTCLKQGGFKSA